MATFYDNLDQSRQKVRKTATKGNKAAMAAAGFHASGREKNWHKVASISPLYAALSRQSAKKAAKGTDALDVLNDTQDATNARSMATLNFAKDAALLAVAAGAGGAPEVASVGDATKITTESASQASPDISGLSEAAAGGDNPLELTEDATGAGFDNVLSAAGGTDALGDVGGVMSGTVTPTQQAIESNQTITDLASKTAEDAVEDKLKKSIEGDAKSQETDAKKQKEDEIAKRKKNLKTLEKLPSVLGSGAALYGAHKNFGDVEDTAMRKVMSQKQDIDLNSIYL